MRWRGLIGRGLRALGAKRRHLAAGFPNSPLEGTILRARGSALPVGRHFFGIVGLPERALTSRLALFMSRPVGAENEAVPAMTNRAATSSRGRWFYLVGS
jgi:hypothetical protein